MLYDNKLAAASRKSAAAANRPELLRWLLPVLLLVLLLPGTAQSQDRGLRSRSNAELIRRAKGYIEADTMLDRAVEALGVVTSRYYADPENKVARRAAIEAFTQLAGIYSYRIFDFAKAYDNMATARLIAEEEKDDYHLANILSVMANLYVLSGNTDSRTNATIDSLTRMSLYHALKGNNEDVIARHAVNFSLARLQDKGWGEFCKQVDSIRQHKYSKGSVYPFIARDILGGMDAYFAGDYKRAERLLTAAYRRVPDRQYTERYRYGILYLLQYVYDHDGNFTAEERNLRQRLKMATDLHLDDYRMFTLRCLSNFFIRQEQPDSADKYYIEYLIFKDKMTSEGSMSRIGSMEMLRQIQKSDQEIKQLSLQRRRAPQRGRRRGPAPRLCANSTLHGVLRRDLLLRLRPRGAGASHAREPAHREHSHQLLLRRQLPPVPEHIPHPARLPPDADRGPQLPHRGVHSRSLRLPLPHLLRLPVQEKHRPDPHRLLEDGRRRHRPRHAAPVGGFG